MEFKIAGRTIGKNGKVFIIAELSANHLQRFELAVKSIKAIKEAGADAVKLQACSPDTLTIDSKRQYFQIKQGTIWDGKYLYQLYKETYTPWAWLPKLKKMAQELNLVCFSSVNDKSAVDFLENLDTPLYKIPSFEITDIPLIEYVASKRKPVLFSTGIATLAEIKEAVNICLAKANNQIAILKCTSTYPARLDELNLKTIPDLEKKFKTIIGLSDHTLSIAVPLAAVALGAQIIEKHFILDRELGGPDATFSLEPQEFREMVIKIREVEESLGVVKYEFTERVKQSREFARSLFIVKDIKAGDRLTGENIRSIRPGFGLAPKYYNKVLGKKVRLNVKRGTPLKWEMLDMSLGCQRKGKAC